MRLEELKREKRKIVSSIGGLVRSLNYHYRKVKVAPEKRKKYHIDKIRELEYKILKRYEELEEINRKIKEAERKEFIDIDENTGYFIYYDRDNEMYYLVRPEKAGATQEILPGFYQCVEITVNYAFETGWEDDPKRDLGAEIKVSVRVERMGREKVHKVADLIHEAFKEFVAHYFGYDFGKPNLAKGYVIARGIMTKIMPESVKEKMEIETPEPIKVGVYFRVTNEPATLIPEERYVRGVVFREWHRGRGEYRKDFDLPFNLKEWFDYIGAWEELM